MRWRSPVDCRAGRVQCAQQGTSLLGNEMRMLPQLAKRQWGNHRARRAARQACVSRRVPHREGSALDWSELGWRRQGDLKLKRAQGIALSNLSNCVMTVRRREQLALQKSDDPNWTPN